MTDCKLPVIAHGCDSINSIPVDKIKSVTAVMAINDFIRIMKFIDRDNRARERTFRNYHDKNPSIRDIGIRTEPAKMVIVSLT